jgi:hypothetical protein
VREEEIESEKENELKKLDSFVYLIWRILKKK